MTKNKKNTISRGFDNPWVNAISIFAVFILLIFSINMQKKSQVTNVEIDIIPIQQNKYLIKEKEILKIFKKQIGFDLNRSIISELDLTRLESILLQDDRIEECEIFVDKHFNININIIQKEPVVRVELQNGEAFYLDKKGAPISTKLYTAIRVPVATGYVHPYKQNFSELASNNLNGILGIANHINQDHFLKALIEQIHVKENGEMVVIPKLGRQRILLGAADELDDKFGKLKVYYKRVVPKEGLDRFPELDLKYKDRIFGVSEEI